MLLVAPPLLTQAQSNRHCSTYHLTPRKLRALRPAGKLALAPSQQAIMAHFDWS
jgi:hypothetical protein